MGPKCALSSEAGQHSEGVSQVNEVNGKRPKKQRKTTHKKTHNINHKMLNAVSASPCALTRHDNKVIYY